MIKLLRYIKPLYWFFIILILLAVYIQVSADLKMPEYLSTILNNAGILEHNRVNGIPFDEATKNVVIDIIWENGLKMLLCAGISIVATIITSLLSARVSTGFSHDLRIQLYNKIQSLSLEEIDNFSTSSLITRTTNDIFQVLMVVVMSLRIAVSAPLMAIKGIISAQEQASTSNLNLIVILSVISLVILVTIIFLIVLPKFKRVQSLTDKLNLVTRENLTGIRVVRANNAQDYEENKFNDVNIDLSKTQIFVNRVMSMLNPGMIIIMNFTSLAILWIGAYAINNNVLPIGSVFAFQQYTMMICMAFMQLIMIFIMLPRGQVSANRINEVLNSNNLILDPSESKYSLETGTIEFKNVSFSYQQGEEPVINNISFKVNNGETLAIIGSTGSGKTTILNLINRFYEASTGEVLVNGINVKEFKQHDLHNLISFVPQKSILFRGTIETNLKFGNEIATDEDMIHALKISQAYDFISKLEDGLHSLVAQGGSNFSGGQKQRLCIARAIIKKANIIMFDDSFSALDLKTDKALREALKNEAEKTTKIIVAQRIGTILDADKILVLDDGKIAGLDKHENLMKNCSVYQEIAYSQLSKEELDNAN